jgi:uncharacterized protein YdeI (YjbR/CyaY-like superfamily)
MQQHKGLPLLTFATPSDWAEWLEQHGTDTAAVWVKLAKKSAPEPAITYVPARNTAIAFGWIDGLTNSLDEHYYAVRFTPRRPKGLWSKVNRVVAEELIASGQMRPAGQAQVDAAKADGRWDAAYDGAATIQVPDDFRKALQANPAAEAAFAALNKTNRYAFLWRIQTARTPAGRVKRIAQYVAMLSEGTVFHP